jgi:hypothetical protein
VRHRIHQKQFFRRRRHPGEYSKAGVLGLPPFIFREKKRAARFFQT